MPSTDTRQDRRHNPLAEEYAPTHTHKQKVGKRKKSQVEGEDEERFVGSKASRKILKIGQDLAEEDEAEREAQKPQRPNPAFEFSSRFPDDVGSEEDREDAQDDGDTWQDDEEEEEIEEIEVDPNDLAMFNRFNPEFDPATLLQPQAPAATEEEEQGTNLADLILERIAQHEATQEGGREVIGGGPPEDAVELPAKVVEVYSQYVCSHNYYFGVSNMQQGRHDTLAV